MGFSGWWCGGNGGRKEESVEGVVWGTLISKLPGEEKRPWLTA